MAGITPWVSCDMCEDYICTLHGKQHVSECDCPDIDAWAEADLFPYAECSAFAVNVFISGRLPEE